ncbi:MAG: AEC family transporter [Hyphomicrobiaceae bacterium]|nr:AEC family transporter [Hyphomicrobiaceae bacterium]MCC0022962.1 AEC family transporter [Hyphomicrobiaceae bacterium]
MLTVLNVVAPVFAIVAFGYLMVRFKLYPASGVQGLLTFVNSFVTPFLLFRAMLTVDFGHAFHPANILPFFVSAFIVFALGIAGGRFLFRNRPGESVATGMIGMYSNLVLLGLPIISRAYGDEALTIAFTLIGLHAAIMMTTALIVMEVVRSDGKELPVAIREALSSIVRNPLLIGIAFGFAGNILGVKLPPIAADFIDIMTRAIVPVALFGLGGALNSYSLRDNWTEALFTSILKLIVHPLIVWTIMVPILRVDPDLARYAVIMAAMPSGVNVYIYASYYNRSVDVAANGILISTVAAVVTVSVWLAVLG